jgi:DtxR family Mn-dependent transcriptional regulator
MKRNEAISREIEEYLETMYRKKEKGEKTTTNDLAKDLGVKPASVSEMLRKLDRMKFVKYEPYAGATLTKKGEAIGATILKRHRLIERFLKFIGLKKKVHEEACILEHAISDEVKRKIENIMKKSGIVALTSLKNGARGKVIYIGSDKKTAKRLMDMGLTEGAVVALTRSAPFKGPLEVEVRGTHLAIDRALASKIFVKLV